MKKIMHKIKEILNKELTIKELCLMTFIISLGIISVIYILNNVTPFGDISLLKVDFYHQYGPMLGELYDRVRSFSSLIYSFNMGLGLPLFRNFLNYMASPFNIIMFLFKRDDLLTSFSIIIGLKAVVSSVTMIYYLSKKWKTTELYLVAFALLYAFSAYFSAYYWNLMWIDGMIFLPLITLGIEQLIDNGKWKLYTISLAVMLVANYYIGYMICIFACLYFLVYSFNKFEFKKGKILVSLKIFLKNGIKFFDFSLLSGGLVAVFLIPLYFSIASISATGGNIPTSQYYLFSLSDFFHYHFSGVMTTVFASDKINAPNVSCGILTLFLLLSFILNVEVSFKEKMGYILLLGFFILAFFYAPLDYVLQGFHVPNDLPYRYSFIYSFVLILISVYAFKNIKKNNYRMIMLIYIVLSMVLLFMASNGYVGINEDMIYINMGILGIYFILYSMVYANKINLKIVYIIMVLVAIGDVTLSINENFNVDQVVSSFYNDYDNVRNQIDYIHNYDDSLFYRIEKTNRLTLNDTSWYDYYGMTGFSSMNYENMAILQYNLGMAGNLINSYIYNQSTPIYDTMFDIKYLMDYSRDTKRYSLLNYDKAQIYQYNYNVGIGYGVNKDILKLSQQYENPFIMQNEYMKLATGIDEVLKPLNLINKETIYSNSNKTVIKYTFKNYDDNLYFYNKSNDVDFIIIDRCLYYNNDNYANYDNVLSGLYDRLENYNEEHIINFISSDKNVSIYIGYNYKNDEKIDLYTIDNDKFITAIDKLRGNQLKLTSFKETRIEGNITLDDNMIVYTSIPYDEGWYVLVDNKEVKAKVLAKALLTFDAPSGEHKIVIYYKIKGLVLGLIISIISILIVCSDIFFHKKIMELLNK